MKKLDVHFIYGVYAIRDAKVGFMAPTVELSDDTAIRNFAYAVNNQEGNINFVPGDYDLFQIGEFDSTKGKLIPLEAPDLIASGVSLIGYGK